MKTNKAKRTRRNKSRISIAKTAFNKKLDLNLRKKIVKCYMWSISLYGAETWALQKVDQKYWKVLKCDAGEGRRRKIGPIM
jgi:hypothetical protein